MKKKIRRCLSIDGDKGEAYGYDVYKSRRDNKIRQLRGL